ncbi:MAG: 50S ribosomal protein L18 [Candidatus Spechtbacteria bacterium]|uniref:Large ribosomal subunit protein uL18 n=1 Tax=Candidatus Spechtbacteria bacterium RIFCSPLOWO2_01_FULL_43_12 TaxID=1802162 RepID=A0A1G2HE84_9BACT|nr:50S ribosomal protein L18 [Candidatus Spechtbacteria bacterium]OGZ60600.1 MAG: 50S ribosomal protein L18 [Candidatus Spechtbacteria bacterium RIFCSPLOWO2_01_FULL_43_12]
MEKTRTTTRKNRHARIRAKVYGTPQKPRLFVFKSNKHIYGSIIDDTAGKTLVSLSDKKLSKKGKGKNDIDMAQKVGAEIGKTATDKGIKNVVFDRGGYNYHGKVKAFAEGARKQGLKF